MVSKLKRPSAVAHEAPSNELASSVHHPELINIDETSSRENRQKAWLWAAMTGLCTVFSIAENRSGEIATALFGSEDDHVVGVDRFSEYE
jgi:transposase-like protein